MPLGPQQAPMYTLYRDVASNDSTPETDKKQGMNMSGYKTANIQVFPEGGGNPTIDVHFWSEEAGKFIQGTTAISKAGVGVNVPHEFSVDVNGRMIYLVVSSLSAGSVKLLVSGFELY